VTDTADFTVGKHVPALSSALRPRPIDELREYGGLRMFRDKRVLDVGAGDGRIALGLAECARESIGVDPDAEAIAIARRRAAGIANVRFEVGAAQELPFPPRRFDVVILSWTL
jgi:ubiquinone/menaquinone biosynthesis C-methylase UbiE